MLEDQDQREVGRECSDGTVDDVAVNEGEGFEVILGLELLGPGPEMVQDLAVGFLRHDERHVKRQQRHSFGDIRRGRGACA